MNLLRQRFGRPLRLGIVGGGPDSWIGRMHRGAAEFDGWWRVAAGVFSSDAARSRAAGPMLGVAADRSYGSLQEMLASEAARDDGIEALAIMAPNDAHYPSAAAALDAGLDVICDKPVTETHAEALDLARRVREGGRLLAIAHGYSAYPMVRLARERVAAGDIGAMRLVQVEYIQSGMATRAGGRPPMTPRLRLGARPARSGQALVMSAIGCHAQHLACFVVGANVSRVTADCGHPGAGRRCRPVSALLEFDVRRTRHLHGHAGRGRRRERHPAARLWRKGMLEWWHRDAGYLRCACRARRRAASARRPRPAAGNAGAGRTPRGHPEGLREAFANIYAEVAQERMERLLGEPVTPRPYPRIEDGAHTMAFIEACLASQREGRWVGVAGA
jgi:predicted dehydrogenase